MSNQTVSDHYVLQFFLSATAANRPYYKRDVLNVCCGPVSERLTLAFDKRWIAASVIEHIEKRIHDGARWLVLLIFCEDRENKAAGGVYTFHPVRWAKLVDALDGGTGLTFDIELGDFVEVPNDETAVVHDRIVKQEVQHPNYMRDTTGEPHADAKFVRCALDDLELPKSKNWDAIAGRFRRLNGLSDSVFFAMTDDVASSYPILPRGATVPAKGRRMELKLKRGQEYQLNMYTISGTRTYFAPPLLTGLDSIVNVVGPFVRQHLNGYCVTYYLLAKSGWAKESAILVAKLPPKDDGSFGSPEMSIHATAVPSKVMISLVVVLLAAGSGLSSLDGPTLVRLGMPSDWSLAAKALGPFVLALGAFLGFRTLPGT